ncbi:hypothetical protein TGARI_275400 [Toxoplasma gondii ARI]|uniref:Uncharacterized protein n=1 Tax=Toxoplasma gondii ARI TaxID=1074872 RepID=A0A139XVI6_TOXGO|nr:hypothetical protein TGARI_275400 [Toxoplasma gondii ARI]
MTGLHPPPQAVFSQPRHEVASFPPSVSSSFPSSLSYPGSSFSFEEISFPCWVVSDGVFRPFGAEKRASPGRWETDGESESDCEVAPALCSSPRDTEIDVALSDPRCLFQILRQRARIPYSLLSRLTRPLALCFSCSSPVIPSFPLHAREREDHERAQAHVHTETRQGKSALYLSETRLPRSGEGGEEGRSVSTFFQTNRRTIALSVSPKELQRMQLLLLSLYESPSNRLPFGVSSSRAARGDVRRHLAALIASRAEKSRPSILALFDQKCRNGLSVDAELLVDVHRNCVFVSSSPVCLARTLRTRARSIHAAFLVLNGPPTSCRFSLGGSESQDINRTPGEGETVVAVLQEENRHAPHGVLEFFPCQMQRSPDTAAETLGKRLTLPVPYFPKTFWGVYTPQGECGAVVLAERPQDGRHRNAHIFPHGLSFPASSSSSFVAFSVTSPAGHFEPRPLLFTCCRCCVMSLSGEKASPRGQDAEQQRVSGVRCKQSLAVAWPRESRRVSSCPKEEKIEGECEDMEEEAEGERFDSAGRSEEDRECNFSQRVSEMRCENLQRADEKCDDGWLSFLNLPPTGHWNSPPTQAPSPSLQVLWVCERPGFSLCLAYAVETRRCVVCLLFGRDSGAIRGGHWALQRAAGVGDCRPSPARPHATSPFHEQLEMRLVFSSPALQALQLLSFCLPGDDPAPEGGGSPRRRETPAHASERNQEGERDTPRGLLPTFLSAPPPQLLLLPTVSVRRTSRGHKREKKGESRCRTREGQLDRETRQRGEEAWRPANGTRSLLPRSLPQTHGERRRVTHSGQERLRLALLDERTDTLVLVPLPSPSSFPSDSSAVPRTSPSFHLDSRDTERIADVVGFVALAPDQAGLVEDGTPSHDVFRLLHILRQSSPEKRSLRLCFALPPPSPASSLRCSLALPGASALPSYLLVLHRGGLLALYAGASLLALLRLPSSFSLSAAPPPPGQRGRQDGMRTAPRAGSAFRTARAASGDWKEGTSETEKRPTKETPCAALPLALSNAVGNRFNLTVLQPLCI